MAVVAPSPGAPVTTDANGDTVITNNGRVGFPFEYPRQTKISTFLAPGDSIFKDGNSWVGTDPNPLVAPLIGDADTPSTTHDCDNPPTPSNTKAEIQDWLAAGGTTGISALSKGELLDLVADLCD